MGKKLYEESKIAAIAEEIRYLAETNKTYTTEQMPEGVSEVYWRGHDTGYYTGEGVGYQSGFDDGWDSGYYSGESDGYDWGFGDGYLHGEEFGYERGKTDGYAEGRQAEYNAFWDSYLDFSITTNKSYLFAGPSWNDTTFKPPKNIKISKYGNSASNMFVYTGISDLRGCLERLGVYIDLTEYEGSNGFYNWFPYSDIKHVGRMLFPEVITMWNGAFTDCTKLETVEELKTDENTGFSTSTFQNCTNLTSLNVTGVIGKNYFDVHWSTKLDKDSITSIINALSPNKTGLTVTLSQAAKDAAFTDAEWTALIATKSNWTIALA